MYDVSMEMDECKYIFSFREVLPRTMGCEAVPHLKSQVPNDHVISCPSTSQGNLELSVVAFQCRLLGPA